MEYLRSNGPGWILLGAVLCVLLAGLVWAARKFRDGAGDDRLTADEQLTKFREMHAQGVLSDEEYRTIKTRLTAQLQGELKETKEPG